MEIDPAILPREKYPVEEIIFQILERIRKPLQEDDRFHPHRDAYLLDIVGNTICADLLDYAKRDSEMAGLCLDYDNNRIIEHFTLVSHVQTHLNSEHPLHGASIRAAVSLFSHKFRPEVVGELIGLLQTRYYVYERMLFHPTKCVAGATLGAAIQWMGWKELPNEFRYIGDSTFLDRLREGSRLTLWVLRKSSDLRERYSAATAEEKLRELEEFPACGAVDTARMLLQSLIPTQKWVDVTFAALKALLRWKETDHKNLLEGYLKGLASLLRGDMGESKAKRNKGSLAKLSPKDYWTSGVTEFEETIKHEYPGKDVEIAELQAVVFPSIQKIIDRIEAGMVLLSRVSNRRFPRRIFCLLGKEIRGKSPGMNDHSVTAKELESKFKDQHVRKLAEREIERRAGLPMGSAVIHCPNAEGPKKIAEVLITHGDHSVPAVPLNKISALEDLPKGLLAAHGEAVKAQEEMYASTWRLSVSVCPPLDHRWNEIQGIIGELLFEIVTEGCFAKGQFENDQTMRRELDQGRTLAGQAGENIVTLIYSDGTQDSRPEKLQLALDEIRNVLLEDRRFAPLLSDLSYAANSSTENEESELIPKLSERLRNALHGGDQQRDFLDER